MHYSVGFFFYTLSFIACLIFLVGIVDMVRIWFLGKNSEVRPPVNPKDWIRHFLRGAFLQPQIREYGTYPWIMHLFIFYGFIGLFLLTSFEFLIARLFSKGSGIHNFFTFGFGSHLIAFWGDLFGLILFIGVIMAIIRRYIIKPDNLHTIEEDSIAIWLLFILTITGFLCEAIRLSADPLSKDVFSSFVVAWSVPLFKGLGFGKKSLVFMFYLHSLVGFAFIAYIPFGKFRHIFATPMVYGFVTSSPYYSKP